MSTSYRKPRTHAGPQQVSRVPSLCRPGNWIKIGQNGALTGRILQVTALTAAVQGPRHEVVWFAHVGDGRCVRVKDVERPATAAEIERARAKGGRRC